MARQGRLFRALRDPSLVAWKLRKLREERLSAAVRWTSNGGMRQRTYASYQRYARHQASKLKRRNSAAKRYDTRLRQALVERLSSDDWRGARVLCLAARLGGEVAAFREQGAFAVGIDLNPGAENPYVLKGDFHALAFPDDCVDAVFTNSLDHALDLDRLLDEVRRVLRPGGRFIVEAMDFTAKPPGRWEVRVWDSPDQLGEAITTAGFRMASMQPIAQPWDGHMMVFRRAD